MSKWPTTSQETRHRTSRVRRRALVVLASILLAGGAAGNQAFAQSFPSVMPLSALDGTNGFRLDGGKPWDFAGFSVSSAGDVNRDGIEDLIVGAPGYNEDAGSAYVVFGRTADFASPTRLDDLADPAFTRGFRIDGNAHSLLGYSVASGGDLNGDGIDDLLASATNERATGSASPGSTYVIYGRSCARAVCSFPTQASLIDGSAGLRIDGAAANDDSGIEVDAAGDVNGDGVGDLIIGANFSEPAGIFNAGSSFVVYGRPDVDYSGPNSLGDLGSAKFGGYRLDGYSDRAEAGYSVSRAGDVNGDAIDDVIVGAWTENGGQGAAYVVFGSRDANRRPPGSLAMLDGADGFRLAGSPTERAGSSVSAAGDVNGDGYDDIIVGAMFASPKGQYTAGTSYVVFGHGDTFEPSIVLANLDGTNGFRIDGVYAGDSTGSRVNAAGDVNGDGYADVIIGAEYANYGAEATGSSYVVFGHGGKFSPAFSLGALNGRNGFRIDGEAQEDYSGNSVASADLNHDGLDDLIIGAQQADPEGNADAGSVYVIFGRR